MGKWKAKATSRRSGPVLPDFEPVEGATGKFPPGLIQTWGKESVAEAVRLIEDPFHDEMYDVLFNSGLTEEEQTIYLESSPDLHLIRAKLLRLEDQVTTHLLPQLEKCLRRVTSNWGTPAQQQSLRDLVLLFDYPNSLRQFLVKGTNVRNMRVMELMTGIMMRMLFQINVRIVDWQIPREVASGLSDHFKGLFEHLSRVNGINYAQSNLVTFANKNRRALRGTESKAPGNFERILNQAPELTPDELDETILEVDELISSRRKAFDGPAKWGPFVFNPVPPQKPIQRTLGVVEAALVLDGSKPFENPVWRAEGGMNFAKNEGAMEFTVDRSLHELCIPLTHFSAQVLFENDPTTVKKAPELYRKLKALFYTQFRDFLKQLPEDPRLEQVRKVPVHIQEEVKEEVKEVVKESPAEEVSVQEVVPELEQPKRLSARECRGFRGNEVLSAMKRLLGDPVRVSGSHYLFRSANGITLPIAIHGSGSVDPNSLRSNIEAWGITEAWRREMGGAREGK